MLKLNLDGHSCFSPSSSEMWMNCPGSLVPNMLKRQEDGDVGSEFAAEGTTAHELAELWLKSGTKPIHKLGEINKVQGFDIEITDEMMSYVQEYVTWCLELKGDHYVEERVDFSHLMPVEKQRGTSDHICCADGKLIITDLKYGQGIKVYAENNKQMQIYALGAMQAYDLLYDFKEIEMRICQPRMHHFDSWTISREQLLAFGEQVREKAVAALQPDAERNPSEKGCQWCKVRATCPAKAAEMEALADEVFGTDGGTIERLNNDTFMVTLPDVNELTIEHLEKIYSKSKAVTSFIEEVGKKLFEFALKGGKLDSFKIVAGRTTRSWGDEVAVIEYFQSLGLEIDDFSPRALVTPAKAEKLLRTKKINLSDLQELVADRTGSPTLAPITDKRPVYSVDEGVNWGE